MVGIELVADKGTREPFPLKRRTGHRVILAARELGAILRPLGDVIVLLPPLASPRKSWAPCATLPWRPSPGAPDR